MTFYFEFYLVVYVSSDQRALGVKLRFYNSLSCHANTRSAAGNIFENWFHNFLERKGR